MPNPWLVRTIDGRCRVKWRDKDVHNREKLKSYCLKEMASAAAYRTGIRRLKGAHPLPEGGDRVRVSPTVRDALILAGRIAPFARSYSKTVEP
jgi:hypothetical protein